MARKSSRILGVLVTVSMISTALFGGTSVNAITGKSAAKKKTTKPVTAKAATNSATAAKALKDAVSKAFNEGKAKGLVEGKTEGLAAGKAAGLTEGKTAGIEEGKTAGLEEGKAAGLEAGKAAGLAEADANYKAKEEADAKAKADADYASKHAKNVIFLIGDGMNSSEVTLARWIKGNPLAMDEIVTGSISNYNSNSIITDSAPAVTAYATGYKSDSGYISVYPSEITVPTKQDVDPKDAYKPLATIMEEAKLNGKSTGIIATSQVQHATPAGFTSHNYNRNDYYDIAKQQVYENLDVVLGGGKEYLVPFDTFNKTDASGNQIGRKDGINLIDEIKNLGYTYVEDTAAMKNATGDKLWGMFGNEGMSYDYDRDPAKEPSLEEMTNKALDVLGKNKDGFFLFVEGSQIDWASHANDPVGVISDTLAYDKAVKAALDFAKKDGNTLVVSITDHGCGGMTIGSKRTDVGYDKLQLSILIDPLKKATLTGAGLEAKLYAEVNADMSNIQDIVAKYYGITDLTSDELAQIKAYLSAKKSGSLNYTVGPVITTRSAIGWTTTGHTGEDVTLYSYGPGKPVGKLDNTDIAKTISAAMDLSLDDTNKELYANIEDNIGYIPGATASLDMTDPQNPVLDIVNGSIKAELPISTNKVIINGKVSYAEGLNLVTRSGAIYVSWDALDIVKNAK